MAAKHRQNKALRSLELRRAALVKLRSDHHHIQAPQPPKSASAVTVDWSHNFRQMLQTDGDWAVQLPQD
jgi:hypothetical protein